MIEHVFIVRLLPKIIEMRFLMRDVLTVKCEPFILVLLTFYTSSPHNINFPVYFSKKSTTQTFISYKIALKSNDNRAKCHLIDENSLKTIFRKIILAI